MIYGSWIIEVSVIFLRKYINENYVLASHVYVLMSALVVLMNTFSLIISLFLHVLLTLDFHNKTKSFEMGGEPRK